MVNQKFITFLRQKAAAARESAAFGGHMHDGGAATLETQIECYLAGQNDKIPTCWASYASEFERVSDPEYQTYLRLQKKFGGK